MAEKTKNKGKMQNTEIIQLGILTATGLLFGLGLVLSSVPVYLIYLLVGLILGNIFLSRKNKTGGLISSVLLLLLAPTLYFFLIDMAGSVLGMIVSLYKIVKLGLRLKRKAG